MRVNVQVTPKKVFTVACNSVNVDTSGNLLLYLDARKTKLLKGFKKWIRFHVDYTVPSTENGK